MLFSSGSPIAKEIVHSLSWRERESEGGRERQRQRQREGGRKEGEIERQRKRAREKEGNGFLTPNASMTRGEGRVCNVGWPRKASF